MPGKSSPPPRVTPSRVSPARGSSARGNSSASAAANGHRNAAALTAKMAAPSPRQTMAVRAAPGKGGAKPEHKILFQKYFKSVGPRTYAVQLKQANNGNHYLVFTEGKRDIATNEVRKTRLFVYSEDFTAYFRLLHETAQFIKTHPVPEEIKLRRHRYWAKKEAEAATAAREAAERQAAAAAAKPIHPQKVTAPAKTTAKKSGRGR